MRGFRCRKGIGKALDDRVLATHCCGRMLAVFGTKSKTSGGDLEAGNAVNGFLEIPILCRDGKGNVEMNEGQRYAVFGRTAPEFRSFEPTVIDS
jgi:hypothetical protein